MINRAYAPTTQKNVILGLAIQVLSAVIDKTSITIFLDPRGGMRVTRRRLGITVSVYLYALYMMLNQIRFFQCSYRVAVFRSVDFSIVVIETILWEGVAFGIINIEINLRGGTGIDFRIIFTAAFLCGSLDVRIVPFTIILCGGIHFKIILRLVATILCCGINLRMDGSHRTILITGTTILRRAFTFIGTFTHSCSFQ